MRVEVVLSLNGVLPETPLPGLSDGGCGGVIPRSCAPCLRRVWQWRDRPRSCVPLALPVRASDDILLLELVVVRSGVWQSRTRTDRPERGATGQPAASERVTPTADEGGASHPSAPGVPQRARLTRANLWRCPIRKSPLSDWRSRSPFPLADKLTRGTQNRQPFWQCHTRRQATWHRLEPVRLILSAQGKAGSERGTPTADEEGGASHPSAPGAPQRAKTYQCRRRPGSGGDSRH